MKRTQTLARLATATGLTAILGLLNPRPAAAVSFQGLGNLGRDPSRGRWASYSSASAVSADGSTVVGYALTVAGGQVYNQGFVWTRSAGIQGLGMWDGFTSSEATDVSGDGSIIVGSCNSFPGRTQEACLWTASREIVGLGSLHQKHGELVSRAYAVSADGNVVVGEAFSEDGPTAFRWDATSGMLGLGDLAGGNWQSAAEDVSADGSVVVGEGTSYSSSWGTVLEAFGWNPVQGMVGLGDLPGGLTQSRANAVSSNGAVIVGYGRSTLDIWETEAFRWTPGEGMIGLGDLPGGLAASCANAVSADGTVIVGYGTTDSSREAMIWDPVHGMRAISDLLRRAGVNLDGWTLHEATDVSADGTVVVGNGIDPEGYFQGWIARLPDEEPPSIVEASASPSILWPPNNQLETVDVVAVVADDSGEATWRVLDVRSNEPESDATDIQFLSDGKILLRASRSGSGSGRVYTIFLQAADAAGNLSDIREIQVSVPHDRRGH